MANRKPTIDWNQVLMAAAANRQEHGLNRPRPTGGGSTRPRGGAARATIKATKQYDRSKKQKKSDGGGDGILDTVKGAASDVLGFAPVRSALELADVPAANIRSHIADIAKSIQDRDFGKTVDAVQNVMNPAILAKGSIGGAADALGATGVGKDLVKGTHANEGLGADQLAHTGSGEYFTRGLKKADLMNTPLGNIWVRRAVGITGDVATDPLSYLGGAGEVAKGVEGAAGQALHSGERGLQAAEAASRVGKSAEEVDKLTQMAKSLRESGNEAAARRAEKLAAATRSTKDITERGINATERTAARSEGERLATKILKGHGASTLSPEEYKAAFGTTGGIKLRVPGTGRVLNPRGTATELTIVPKGITDKVTAALRGVKAGTLDNKAAQAIAEKLGGSEAKQGLRDAIKAGDEAAVGRQLRLNEIMKTANARKEAGLRLLPDAQIGGETVSKSTDVGERAMDVYTKRIHPLLAGQDHEAVIHAIETGNFDGVKGAQEIKDYLRELHRTAEANGVPIAQRENYFPRWLTDEAKAARGAKGDIGGLGGKATFEKGRINEELVQKIEQGTGQKLDVTDEAGIRKAVEEWASRELPNLPKGYYEKNINKVLPHYVEALTDRVRTAEIVKRLEEQGIAVPSYIQKGGVIGRNAAKRAAKALAIAEEASKGAHTAEAASKEAKGYADAMDALAKDAEVRGSAQAADVSAQQFMDLGGTGGAQTVSGASVASPEDFQGLSGYGLDQNAPKVAGVKDDQGLGGLPAEWEAKLREAEVQGTAAEQRTEAQRLADLKAQEAAGIDVNPQASAAAKQALPPEVLSAAEAAMNAPMAQRAEAMAKFQKVLDDLGINANDAIDAVAEKNALGSVAAETGKPMATAADVFGRLEELRAASPTGNAFDSLSEEEMQALRNNFADTLQKDIADGGVKSKGGNLPRAEKIRREADKLNAQLEKLDHQNLRLLAAKSSNALDQVKTELGRAPLNAETDVHPLDMLHELTGGADNAAAVQQRAGIRDAALADMNLKGSGPTGDLQSQVDNILKDFQAPAVGGSPEANTAKLADYPNESTVTLYRGEPSTQANAARGVHFYASEKYANNFAGADGIVYKVDVPESVVQAGQKAARDAGDVGITLPPDWADVSYPRDAAAGAADVAPSEPAITQDVPPGGDYNREAWHDQQYWNDANSAEHVATVQKETAAATDNLKMRRMALEERIKSGTMTDEEAMRALTELQTETQKTIARAAEGIPPLRHASAQTGEHVIEPATKEAAQAAYDNVGASLYRSQRTIEAQAAADQATGAYDAFAADANAGIQSNDRVNGILDSIDQGQAGGVQPPAQADMGQVAQDPYAADAAAGINDPNNPVNQALDRIDTGGGAGGPGGPAQPPGGGMGGGPPQGPQHPGEVAGAYTSLGNDLKGLEVGYNDAQRKLAQYQAKGWDTTWIEDRLKIYEAARQEADGFARRSMQFQADAKDALDQMDQLLTRRAQFRNTAADLNTPQFKTALRDEINKSMARLKADPSLAAPNDIADILNATSKITTPDGVRQFLKYYDKALNYIKAWQLATPGFHVRNYMGGMFNNYLADVQPGIYRKWMLDKRAFEAGTLTGPERELMAQAIPVVGSAQYSAFEVGGMETASAMQRANPLSKNFEWLTANRKFGAKVEENLRGPLVYDRLLKGKSLDEAVSDMVRYHFDYQDLSKFERGTVKRIIPFYTWTRHNLPLQMEMYLQAPGKYARYWQAKQEIELGTTPEGVVPQYFLNEGFGIHTPFNFGGGDVYLTPDLPFTSTVQQALPDPTNVDLSRPGTYPSALEGYASMVTPLLKTPAERMMNKQFFKGIPFTDKKYDAPELWKQTPGLYQGLKAVGLIDGKGKISDRDQYTVEQYLPLLGRLRRLGGGASKDDTRLVSSWMSFLGVPLRTNTQYEQMLEKMRRKYQGKQSGNPYQQLRTERQARYGG